MAETNRYRFDKRVRKRKFLKYFFVFFVAFFPVVAFNVLVSKYLSNGLVIFLDCVIMLAIVLPLSYLVDRHYAKKDAKLEAKIKEREELNKKKKQILEDSYSRIRKEKADKKTKEKSEKEITNNKKDKGK